MSNKENNKPVQITELVLRDGHQSLFATRMRIDDMLPIAEKLDKIGYWSMESWGGATFDFTYSLPRIFSKKTNTSIKCSATPRLH